MALKDFLNIRKLHWNSLRQAEDAEEIKDETAVGDETAEVSEGAEGAEAQSEAVSEGDASVQIEENAAEASEVKEEPAPERLIKCPKCGKNISKERAAKNRFICYECGGYFRVKTKNRIAMVTDRNTFVPWFEEMPISNPLGDAAYEDKLAKAKEETGLSEAVTVGIGKIYGEDAVIGVCDSKFMMASMGHVVGEKITAAVERATEMKLPVFLFCCSGGARMQEGIISLMQMEKTSAALRRHSDAGLFYCSILTDPTTGGVTASFAMLGDVIMAEPGALVGFAGPRVIAQTIGRELPKGFQRAEFLLEHGAIDGIVERKNLKKTMFFLLMANKQNKSYANFTAKNVHYQGLSELLKERERLSTPKSAWQRVKGNRDLARPSSVDYIERIFDVFVEAHGDRAFRDDRALIGGLAFFEGQPVTVLADEKGSNLIECRERNFGMPMAEGYRKALRLMKQAEKFNRPIVSFINTPGAFCGLEAEERSIGEAIARNLWEMAGLTVPVLCILIGEGGSGGALGTAVGNEVWMLENATYSIISPEGYASILWKDSSRQAEAADAMRITSEDLKELQVIEQVIPEFGGADKETVDGIAAYMKEEMRGFFRRFDKMSREEIVKHRYERFRKF